MKVITIAIFAILLSISNGLSREKSDCTEFKKYSIKYTWCKSKNLGKAVKCKVDNLKKGKNSNK